MQEQTSSNENTVPTTGRGYNRHATDAQHEATGVATDLYAPVPGDDDDTRPGMVGSSRTSSTTSSDDWRDETSRTTGVAPSAYGRQESVTPSGTQSAYTMRSRSGQSGGGIMQKVQENPLAVVAAATAGGMLVGRMMRNRGQRRSEGYLRNASSRGFQGYQSSPSYQQPSFRPYQPPPYQGNQGYSGYQGYQQSGYQMPSEFQGTPQYRADQEFRPEQGFQGRHENFPGGSNWD